MTTERLIAILAYCAHEPYEHGADACIRHCKDCPLHGEHYCRSLVMERASIVIAAQMEKIRELEALQAPKVMTAKEILAWAETPEEIRKPIYYEPREGDGHLVVNTRSPRDYYLVAFDGDGRCWTSRPTDKQRKEVPWDAAF